MPPNPPTDTTSDAQAAFEPAPSSLRGWAYWQRQVNVVMPGSLNTANRLLRAARSALGGQGG